MMTTNYSVTETAYGLSFDEDFDPTCFNISFQLDPENDLSPSGWMTFEPRKSLATMAYYGHPEDLLPSLYNYDLYSSVMGREVLIGFNEYKLGDLYRAAKAYTIHMVQAHIAEVEHINKERA